MSASSKNLGGRTGEFSTSCLAFCAELMGESGGADLLSLLTVESDLSLLLIVELVLGAGLTGDSDGGDLLSLLTVGRVHDDGNVELLLLGSESVDDDDGDIDSSEDNNGLSVGSFLDMEVSIPNASCALSDTY